MMKSLIELSLSKGEYGGGFSAIDYFDGMIDDVRIYNGALNATEIQNFN